MSSTFEVQAPFDLSVIKEIPLNSESDVEKALSLAKATFEGESIPLPERIEILKRLMASIGARREELAVEAAREGGKPLIDSLVEVDRGIQGIENAIQSVFELKGQEITMGITSSSMNRRAFTIREPIGPVVAVSAFNHPFNLIIHQVIPAVITGCPVIVKPAKTTPISCMNIVEMLYEAGLPKQWCQVLHLDNELAEKLVTDSRVKFFSFIGSSRVGWMLKSKLAPGTRCALEHGGAAPVIIEPDANLESMIPLLVKGGYYHAGQVCVSVQRIFAHKDIKNDVIDLMKAEIEKLKVGDPTLKDTDIGPLISPRENDRVHDWIEESKSMGAKLIFGGDKISESCHQPTLLADVASDSKIAQFEIFGPASFVNSYETLEEGIKKANSLDYSFQSSVFTKDLDAAFKCTEKLRAATVLVNDHTAFRVDWMPFAGHDVSGFGIGGIPYTMKDMCEEKLVVFRSNSI